MIRALTDFIVPELPAGGTGAEQAAVVLGHLHVLRGQIDIASEFERYELRHAIEEAHAVLDVARGGSLTTAVVEALRTALDGVADRDAPAGSAKHRVDPAGAGAGGPRRGRGRQPGRHHTGLSGGPALRARTRHGKSRTLRRQRLRVRGNRPP